VQYNMACSGLPSMPEVIPEDVAEAVAAAAQASGIRLAAVSGTYNMIHPDPAVRERGHARELGAVDLIAPERPRVHEEQDLKGDRGNGQDRRDNPFRGAEPDGDRPPCCRPLAFRPSLGHGFIRATTAIAGVNRRRIRVGR